MDPNKISEDPADYGSKGQTWAPEFVRYMKYIVTHPAYAGMPDAVKDDGKIQWEAPSNRSGGQYQFTHNKRRDWWKKKAKKIGIDPHSDQWISRTAKAIHPTGEKPCKRCGTTMQLAYAYPQANLIKRFKKAFGDDFAVSDSDPIVSILQAAKDRYEDEALLRLPQVLQTKTIAVPEFPDFDELLLWVEDEYIPSEPSMLSPGAMSNAPDRFDGFHSFNRCCRGKADTGRHASNLRSYTTDRRVFEFWSDGDWIAADRLMGLVKSQLREAACADGGEGPPTADHIGPISLGFCHRPEFRLLSKAANSAKNNRMTLLDVTDLLKREAQGIQVASWYAASLWNLRKASVDTDEKALRLSKLLRDNQRIAMEILCRLYDARQLAFLTYLLELRYAERNVEFVNLRSENFLTTYDKLELSRRNTKYAIEQKARRLRIGFEALRSYGEKTNRHTFMAAEDAVNICVERVNSYLARISNDLQELENQIRSALMPTDGILTEESLRAIAKVIPTGKFEEYEQAKNILSSAMEAVARELSRMWSSDRYVRGSFELED